MSKSSRIEPLISRCGKALASVKLSPPPLRASSKVRDSLRSVPLASIPQEEEAFEREFEFWICQNQQQQMIQQRHVQQPAGPQHAILSAPMPTSFFPNSCPTHTLSLPHPTVPQRRKSTMHISLEERPMYLPRQQSQPYPPPSSRASHRHSVMDMDISDADFMQHDQVNLRAIYPEYNLSKYKNIKSIKAI